MKTSLLLLIHVVLVTAVHSQELSVKNLVAAASQTRSKSDHFFKQKDFLLEEVTQKNDTIVQSYSIKKKRRNREDSVVRNLVRQMTARKEMSIVYKTSSIDEYNELKKEFKEHGFHCNGDTIAASPYLLFQKADIVARATASPGDTTAGELPVYSIEIQKKELPAAKEIEYAEDLLAFCSHENLVYVFGENNVKNDIYYFSETETNRCSVLFPNTERQAVFIWEDEANDYGLSYLVLGGQVTIKSASEDNLHVAQNAWYLKSMIHAGMSLRELRRLNGIDFTFYGVKTKFSGMVVPGSSGKMDFKKENVVLACMNCDDPYMSEKSTLSADEAIAEGRRFFVHTIMLSPESY